MLYYDQSRNLQQPWSQLDDGTLVEAYREHATEAAFSELVHRYERRLFRVLVGMVSDVSLAEELCQRALVKAALNLDQLANGQAFYGWLLRMARAAALDELKKPARRRREEFEESRMELRESEPNHGVKNAIHRVLQRLTDEERLTILLADLEQLTIGEISKILGTTNSATKMRISRARVRFREIYQEMTGNGRDQE